MQEAAPLSADARGALIRALAAEVGFEKVGLAKARPLDPAPFERFLDAGYAADMHYLHDERRTDPTKLLPGAQTVVIFALSYFDPEQPGGRVARYARGRDYHSILHKKLQKLRRRLLAADPGLGTYGAVDWGPIAEKPWAQEAGIGWIGKNGCLITRSHGSWLLLASLVLDRPATPYDTPHENHCGSCSACQPACPTEAFPEPYVVDSRRCLSYQTIENRAELPDSIKERAEGWLFGCDLCQEVCPWNQRFAQPSPEPGFAPKEAGLWDVPLDRLITMEHGEWALRARGSPMARPKHFGTVRNALVLAGGSGDTGLLEASATRLADPHPGVRDAAEWAVLRLGGEVEALRRSVPQLPPCGEGLPKLEGSPAGSGRRSKRTRGPGSASES